MRIFRAINLYRLRVDCPFLFKNKLKIKGR